MRVLHLLSNFKWTGPSDPAVSLAAGLAASDVDVVLRTASYLKGGSINHVEEKARELGLPPVLDLSLGKHRSPLRDRADVRRLSRILESERFDLVHCHLPNDFRIAARACRRPGIPVVRSLYDTDPDALDARDVRAISRRAAEVLVFSRRVRDRLEDGGIEARRLHAVDPIVDLERFDPDREVNDLRGKLGFGAEDFVAGIVARVQPQRRFDLLLDVAERVSREIPNFRVVVIGRGSKIDEVARDPARERGLLDRVVYFPGYFRGDEYVAMMRMLDVKLFLVPGTDGTARAVREALASGRPVVCTPRGMLSELVLDGKTGHVVEETPEAFTRTLLELARDSELRRRLGAQAREDAVRRFDPARQVASVREIYAGCLSTPDAS